MSDAPVSAIKAVATDFFRWWWNQPGTNTDQGFDEWAAGPGAAALTAARIEGERVDLERAAKIADNAELQWRSAADAPPITATGNAARMLHLALAANEIALTIRALAKELPHDHD